MDINEDYITLRPAISDQVRDRKSVVDVHNAA